MRVLRPLVLATALMAGSLALAPSPATAAAPPPFPVESIVDHQVSGGLAQDTYIVKFRAGAQRGQAIRDARDAGLQIHRELAHVFDGAVVSGTPASIDRVRRLPQVETVEPSTPVNTSATQTEPPWNLDRIDQRALPLDDRYTYDATAPDVTAYVIDSGIIPHIEFSDRIARVAGVGGDWEDCNGHGTHVAGTLGGTYSGVAKDVQIVAIKVFGCDGRGNSATTIAAIDWAIGDHQEHPGHAVANLSLGGPASFLMDEAVDRLMAAGITTAVAAGNDGVDACDYSPARATSALTVANSTDGDHEAGSSNYGLCVDLYAPGTRIVSAYIGSDDTFAVLSGTSMASPHVAGVAALLQSGNPGWTSAEVKDEILRTATPNVISNPSVGTPNLLLHSAAPTTTPVTPQAPTFTDRCGTDFDRYTIPATTGVTYLANGAVKASGTHPAQGRVTITARAEAGHHLTGTTSWSRTFANSTSFSDVSPGTQFSQEICWMAINQITTGYDDGTYRPVQPVNRDAMAAFMYRLAGSPAFTPPARSPFSDVKPTTQFYKEITWLASKKISTGYLDGTFRPTQPVTRDAMAAFMYRLAGTPAWTAPARSPFNDVTRSTQFYEEITWLASTKITTGYDDGTYRPVQPVNRDAMAAFMYRLKGVNKLV